MALATINQLFLVMSSYSSSCKEATLTGLCCTFGNQRYKDTAPTGLCRLLKNRTNPCKTDIYTIPWVIT